MDDVSPPVGSEDNHGRPSSQSNTGGDLAIWGSVDGFAFPATIRGWALKRQGTTLVPGLHIEVLQGDMLIAIGKLSLPRPDLTDQADIQAGFRLECGGGGVGRGVPGRRAGGAGRR